MHSPVIIIPAKERMNMKYRIVLLVGVLIGFSSALFAQNSASTNGDASARVINPISIQNINNLNFGTLIWPPSGTGTATMSPLISGFPTPQLASVSGGVTTTLQGSSDAIHSYGPGPASFNAKGEDGFTFLVVLPSSTIHITADHGTATLDVTDFTTNLPGNVGLLTLGIPAATIGNCYFMVGATVHVPTGAFADWYDGNFPITVNYN
jgi:hypothetical protein